MFKRLLVVLSRYRSLLRTDFPTTRCHVWALLNVLETVPRFQGRPFIQQHGAKRWEVGGAKAHMWRALVWSILAAAASMKVDITEVRSLHNTLTSSRPCHAAFGEREFVQPRWSTSAVYRRNTPHTCHVLKSGHYSQRHHILLLLRGGADGGALERGGLASSHDAGDGEGVPGHQAEKLSHHVQAERWGPGGIFSTEVASAAQSAKKQDKMLLVRRWRGAGVRF